MPLLDHALPIPAPRPGLVGLRPLAALVPADPPALWCLRCHRLAVQPHEHDCPTSPDPK